MAAVVGEEEADVEEEEVEEVEGRRGGEEEVGEVESTEEVQLRHHVMGRGSALVASKPFQYEGRGSESRSSRHGGTLGKSLTRSCLCRFGVKFRHSIRAASGALLSSGLEEAL